jgi:hypothetical protein
MVGTNPWIDAQLPIPFLARSSAENALIATGTLCAFSARFCAVTTISSNAAGLASVRRVRAMAGADAAHDVATVAMTSREIRLLTLLIFVTPEVLT